MSDSKVSALPAAAALTGLEQTNLVQSGGSVRSTVNDVRDGAGAPLTLALQSGIQASPASGKAKVFFRNKAGRASLEVQGGLAGEKDYAVQQAIYSNSIIELWPSNGTTLAGRGGTWVSAGGTVSHPALVASSRRNSHRRINFVTTAAAQITSGVRLSSAPSILRGAVTDVGGFFAFFRFGWSSMASTGVRCFVGLSAAALSTTAEPSSLLNMIGVGFDSTDGGAAWYLMSNDATGAATKTLISSALAPRDLDNFYDLTLFCPPNASFICVRLFNQTSQTVVLDNVMVTTDLPVANVFMMPQAVVNTAATTTLTFGLDVGQIYVESDL